MPRHTQRGLSLVFACLIVAGCSSGQKTAVDGPGASSSSARHPGASTTPTPATPRGTSGATSAATSAPKPSATTGAPNVVGSPVKNGASSSSSPHPALPVKVVLTPTCVAQGGTMSIQVTTAPKTPVAYVAYYNGNKSGAQPPSGDGYGGNAGDVTDSQGHYTSTWVVAANAPAGPARVQVVAAQKGSYSNTYTPFRVVKAGASCA